MSLEGVESFIDLPQEEAALLQVVPPAWRAPTAVLGEPGATLAPFIPLRLPFEPLLPHHNHDTALQVAPKTELHHDHQTFLPGWAP